MCMCMGFRCVLGDVLGVYNSEVDRWVDTCRLYVLVVLCCVGCSFNFIGLLGERGGENEWNGVG